jgi:hypothetical protein
MRPRKSKRNAKLKVGWRPIILDSMPYTNMLQQASQQAFSSHHKSLLNNLGYIEQLAHYYDQYT